VKDECWKSGKRVLTGKKHVEFESDYNTREGDSKSYVRMGPLQVNTSLVGCSPPSRRLRLVLLSPLFYSQHYSTLSQTPKTFLHNLIFKRLGSEFCFEKIKLFITTHTLDESFLICIIKV